MCGDALACACVSHARALRIERQRLSLSQRQVADGMTVWVGLRIRDKEGEGMTRESIDSSVRRMCIGVCTYVPMSRSYLWGML